jgi:hypothetical protein
MEGLPGVILRRPAGMAPTLNNIKLCCYWLAENKDAVGTWLASRANAPELFLTSPTSVGRQRSPISLLWHGSARSGHQRVIFAI